MEQKSNTKRLVVLAFLIALEIILTRFCSIQTPIVRIGFGFLPVAMMGILYGPLWAGIGYAAGDVLGMLIFPSAAYFPGFTLTAFLTGMIFGFFLKGKEITWKSVLPARLSILMGDGYLALLPARILKCVLMLPIHLILIPFVWNRIVSKIPFAGQMTA